MPVTTPSTVCNEGSQLRSGDRLGLAAALFFLALSNLDNEEFPSSNTSRIALHKTPDSQAAG